MDIALKELEKLQKLTDFEPSKPSSSISILTAASLASKGKATTSVADSLDGLLASLRDIKERLEAGSASEDDIQSIGTIIDERKKEVDDRQKEVYATLGRIGKALDKVISLDSTIDLRAQNYFHFHLETCESCPRATGSLYVCRSSRGNGTDDCSSPSPDGSV